MQYMNYQMVDFPRGSHIYLGYGVNIVCTSCVLLLPIINLASTS